MSESGHINGHEHVTEMEKYVMEFNKLVPPTWEIENVLDEDYFMFKAGKNICKKCKEEKCIERIYKVFNSDRLVCDECIVRYVENREGNYT